MTYSIPRDVFLLLEAAFNNDNDLRGELATKEFVRVEIGEVRVEISEARADLSRNTFLLKILIAIAVFGLTLFNPAFIKLIELAVK